MEKVSDKKFKDKGKTVSWPDANKKIKKKKKVSKVNAINAVPPAPATNAVPPALAANAVPPAPVTLSYPPQALACAPVTNGSGAVSWGKEKTEDKLEQFCGFIFMCNAQTKPECFRYRVFGLPGGRRQVVEKIKEGVTLFLFDFDLKLLYGVYKATCRGRLNLESSAFGGRFPAQVRFVNDKDCLPLPERVFKGAIKDNYEGSKFKPELNDQQVRDLLLLFRPCVASSSAVAPMPALVPPQMMQPSALEDQFQHSTRLPRPPQDPYLVGMQHGHAAPMIELPPPQDPYLVGMQNGCAAPMSEQHSVQHSVVLTSQLYGTEATIDHAYPTLEHQVPPTPNEPYYFAQNQRLYAAEDAAQTVQDHYPRSWAAQKMDHRERLVGLEREYHQLPLQREGQFDLQQSNVAGYYNSYPTPPTSHGPPLMHPHDPVPGRPGLAERDGPVSSYYSFVGATRLHR
ncbi:unnamed protein product [Camellia sinensis]